MGASLDPYELHQTRSTLDFVEGLSSHMLDMFPFLSEVNVNRQWAGLSDMTPDFAPIMGVTPVEGFFLDSGWGTWGFKATPVCGKTMSHTVATGRNHPLIEGFTLERFARYQLTGEKGAASVGSLMKLLVCPLNGPRPVSEFAYGGEVRRSPDPDTCSDAEWSDYVFNRSGSPGIKYEWWCHLASGYWFVALRDTLRDTVTDTFPSRAGARRPAAERAGFVMYRLTAHADEWIDRSASITFQFEGRSLQGFAGDTISSALLAAGVPYLGRSFKYHRRRSVLSFANHDSNTLFQVDAVPNVRGDVTLLREGMSIAAVNTFGGLTHDKARVLDRFARWLPVGFYYKAFHSKRWFPRWERMFRALTGLGAVSLDAPRRYSAKRYGFCDVLVIGGGPSGLSAALEAAAAGARVAIADEALRLGGDGSSSTLEEQRATQSLVDAVRGHAAITVYAPRWQRGTTPIIGCRCSSPGGSPRCVRVPWSSPPG